ncbi:virulence factor TspB C-terminal domain-related protein [Burkholderia cenocepacia]|uniref:virulence factor TspB C-terminal domain-related protein n=1 Tax=Burkholderia cenocepacia TaxID=95486 RepID=UPI002651504D|nr:virulence factor TspB C-terminal domain-related protein [Burkholderia cenocepacia]MDN7680967.1 virulence factor TspB C-terminal domain-related protein [Burkholderia cenocepacia]
MFKRLVVVFALVSMLCHQQAANAQALAVLEPVFNGVINRAVGGAILANLERRGLVTAANDAVFQSTMKWVGQAANDASYVGAAAGTVASIAGAPVWLATAVGVGALAAAGAVAWGVYELTQSGTASTPQLTLTPTTATAPGGASSPNGASSPGGASSPSGGSGPVQEVPAGGGLYSGPSKVTPGYGALPSDYRFYVATVVGGTAVVGACTAQRDCAVQAAYFDAQQCKYPLTFTSVGTGCSIVVDASPASGFTGSDGVTLYTYNAHLAYTDSNGTGRSVDGQYSVYENPSYVPSTQPQPVTGTLTQLPITNDMLTAPAPNELTSQLAEKLWEKASAMPGYNGYPYSSVNPVSSADLASSGQSPTWSDLVEGTPKASVSDSTVSIAPDFYPSTGTGTGTTPSNSSGCVAGSQLAGCVPLGDVPASAPIPASETSIPFAPWSIGSVDGTCPAPQTVRIFDADYSFSFDPFCTVVQKLRPLVLALCALAAAFIVAMGVSL